MNRLCLLLLLAFQAPDKPATPPIVTRFDAAAFGVSPASPDNSAAFQRAHDFAAKAVAGTTRRATVYFPPGSYQVDGPIFSDASCVRWLGDGRGAAQSSVIRAADGYSGPIFVVGLPRGTPPDASYRPDLYKILDASAAAKPGQRFGIRTRGDLFAMSQGSSLTHGGMSLANRNAPDYWQSHDYLTVEAAVEGFNGGRMPAAFVGSGNGVQAPEPFVLSCGGNGTYTLFVGYQSERWGDVKVASYTFPDGGATGVVRVTCQINLKAGTVAAWVNGVQVAAKGPALPQGVRFPEPGTAPKDNVHAFFVNGQYNPAAMGKADFALYGFSVSRTLKYADLGVGSSQTPNPQLCGGLLTIPGGLTGGTFALTIAGKTTPPIPANPTTDQIRAAVEAVVGAGRVAVGYDPGWGRVWRLTGVGVDLSGTPGCGDGSGLTECIVTDAYRYFPGTAQHADSPSVDPWNVARLPFTEPPGTRHLAVAGNYCVASASLFLVNAATGGPITSEVSFEGLEVDGGPAYGTGVMMWHSLETRFLDCKITGGLWGVANLIFGANYRVMLRDCVLTGYDAGFVGYWTDALMDRVNFANNGRWPIRLVASNADVRHVNVAATGSPQYGFCRITTGIYGGLYTFDHVMVDDEGVPYGKAFFHAERHAYGNVLLRVESVYTGAYGDAPLFDLHDLAAGGPYGRAILDARGIQNGGRGPGVAVDGPNWTGEVRTSNVFGLVNSGAFPGATGLAVPSATTPVVAP